MRERVLVVVLAGVLPACSLYFPSPQGGDLTDAGIPSSCEHGYSAEIYSPSEGEHVSPAVHFEFRYLPGVLPDEVFALQDQTGRYWSQGTWGVDGVNDTYDTTLEPGLDYTLTLSWTCPTGSLEVPLAVRHFHVDDGVVVDAGMYPADAAPAR